MTRALRAIAHDLGCELDLRDLALALLCAPVVLAGLWAGVALLYALGPT